MSSTIQEKKVCYELVSPLNFRYNDKETHEKFIQFIRAMKSENNMFWSDVKYFMDKEEFLRRFPCYYNIVEDIYDREYCTETPYKCMLKDIHLVSAVEEIYNDRIKRLRQKFWESLPDDIREQYI